MAFLLSKAALIATILILLGLSYLLEEPGQRMAGGRKPSQFTNPRTSSINYQSSKNCSCQLITNCLSAISSNKPPTFCGFQGIQRKVCCDSEENGNANVTEADLNDRLKSLLETAQLQSNAAQFYRNPNLFNRERLRSNGNGESETRNGQGSINRVSTTVTTSRTPTTVKTTPITTPITTPSTTTTFTPSSSSSTTTTIQENLASTEIPENLETPDLTSVNGESASEASSIGTDFEDDLTSTKSTTPTVSESATEPSNLESVDANEEFEDEVITSTITPLSSSSTTEAIVSSSQKGPENINDLFQVEATTAATATATQEQKQNRKLPPPDLPYTTLDENTLRNLQQLAGSFLAEYFPQQYTDLLKNFTKFGNVSLIDNIPVPKDKSKSELETEVFNKLFGISQNKDKGADELMKMTTAAGSFRVEDDDSYELENIGEIEDILNITGLRTEKPKSISLSSSTEDKTGVGDVTESSSDITHSLTNDGEEIGGLNLTETTTEPALALTKAKTTPIPELIESTTMNAQEFISSTMSKGTKFPIPANENIFESSTLKDFSDMEKIFVPNRDTTTSIIASSLSEVSNAEESSKSEVLSEIIATTATSTGQSQSTDEDFTVPTVSTSAPSTSRPLLSSNSTNSTSNMEEIDFKSEASLNQEQSQENDTFSADIYSTTFMPDFHKSSTTTLSLRNIKEDDILTTTTEKLTNAITTFTTPIEDESTESDSDTSAIQTTTPIDNISSTLNSNKSEINDDGEFTTTENSQSDTTLHMTKHTYTNPEYIQTTTKSNFDDKITHNEEIPATQMPTESTVTKENEDVKITTTPLSPISGTTISSLSTENSIIMQDVASPTKSTSSDNMTDVESTTSSTTSNVEENVTTSDTPSEDVLSPRKFPGEVPTGHSLTQEDKTKILDDHDLNFFVQEKNKMIAEKEKTILEQEISTKSQLDAYSSTTTAEKFLLGDIPNSTESDIMTTTIDARIASEISSTSATTTHDFTTTVVALSPAETNTISPTRRPDTLTLEELGTNSKGKNESDEIEDMISTTQSSTDNSKEMEFNKEEKSTNDINETLNKQLMQELDQDEETTTTSDMKAISSSDAVTGKNETSESVTINLTTEFPESTTPKTVNSEEKIYGNVLDIVSVSTISVSVKPTLDSEIQNLVNKTDDAEIHLESLSTTSKTATSEDVKESQNQSVKPETTTAMDEDVTTMTSNGKLSISTTPKSLQILEFSPTNAEELEFTIAQTTVTTTSTSLKPSSTELITATTEQSLDSNQDMSKEIASTTLGKSVSESEPTTVKNEPIVRDGEIEKTDFTLENELFNLLNKTSQFKTTTPGSKTTLQQPSTQTTLLPEQIDEKTEREEIESTTVDSSFKTNNVTTTTMELPEGQNITTENEMKAGIDELSTTSSTTIQQDEESTTNPASNTNTISIKMLHNPKETEITATTDRDDLDDILNEIESSDDNEKQKTEISSISPFNNKIKLQKLPISSRQNVTSETTTVFGIEISSNLTTESSLEIEEATLTMNVKGTFTTMPGTGVEISTTTEPSKINHFDEFVNNFEKIKTSSYNGVLDFTTPPSTSTTVETTAISEKIDITTTERAETEHEERELTTQPSVTSGESVSDKDNESTTFSTKTVLFSPTGDASKVASAVTEKVDVGTTEKATTSNTGPVEESEFTTPTLSTVTEKQQETKTFSTFTDDTNSDNIRTTTENELTTVKNATKSDDNKETTTTAFFSEFETSSTSPREIATNTTTTRSPQDVDLITEIAANVDSTSSGNVEVTTLKSSQESTDTIKTIESKMVIVPTTIETPSSTDTENGTTSKNMPEKEMEATTESPTLHKSGESISEQANSTTTEKTESDTSVVKITSAKDFTTESAINAETVSKENEMTTVEILTEILQTTTTAVQNMDEITTEQSLTTNYHENSTQHLESTTKTTTISPRNDQSSTTESHNTVENAGTTKMQDVEMTTMKQAEDESIDTEKVLSKTTNAPKTTTAVNEIIADDFTTESVNGESPTEKYIESSTPHLLTGISQPTTIPASNSADIRTTTENALHENTAKPGENESSEVEPTPQSENPMPTTNVPITSSKSAIGTEKISQTSGESSTVNTNDMTETTTMEQSDTGVETTTQEMHSISKTTTFVTSTPITIKVGGAEDFTTTEPPTQSMKEKATGESRTDITTSPVSITTAVPLSKEGTSTDNNDEVTTTTDSTTLRNKLKPPIASRKNVTSEATVFGIEISSNLTTESSLEIEEATLTMNVKGTFTTMPGTGVEISTTTEPSKINPLEEFANNFEKIKTSSDNGVLDFTTPPSTSTTVETTAISEKIDITTTEKVETENEEREPTTQPSVTSGESVSDKDNESTTFSTKTVLFSPTGDASKVASAVTEKVNVGTTEKATTSNTGPVEESEFTTPTLSTVTEKQETKILSTFTDDTDLDNIRTTTENELSTLKNARKSDDSEETTTTAYFSEFETSSTPPREIATNTTTTRNPQDVDLITEIAANVETTSSGDVEVTTLKSSQESTDTIKTIESKMIIVPTTIETPSSKETENNSTSENMPEKEMEATTESPTLYKSGESSSEKTDSTTTEKTESDTSVVKITSAKDFTTESAIDAETVSKENEMTTVATLTEILQTTTTAVQNIDEITTEQSLTTNYHENSTQNLESTTKTTTVSPRNDQSSTTQSHNTGESDGTTKMQDVEMTTMKQAEDESIETEKVLSKTTNAPKTTTVVNEIIADDFTTESVNGENPTEKYIEPSTPRLFTEILQPTTILGSNSADIRATTENALHENTAKPGESESSEVETTPQSENPMPTTNVPITSSKSAIGTEKISQTDFTSGESSTVNTNDKTETTTMEQSGTGVETTTQEMHSISKITTFAPSTPITIKVGGAEDFTTTEPSTQSMKEKATGESRTDITTSTVSITTAVPLSKEGTSTDNNDEITTTTDSTTFRNKMSNGEEGRTTEKTEEVTTESGINPTTKIEKSVMKDTTNKTDESIIPAVTIKGIDFTTTMSSVLLENPAENLIEDHENGKIGENETNEKQDRKKAMKVESTTAIMLKQNVSEEISPKSVGRSASSKFNGESDDKSTGSTTEQPLTTTAIPQNENQSDAASTTEQSDEAGTDTTEKVDINLISSQSGESVTTTLKTVDLMEDVTSTTEPSSYNVTLQNSSEMSTEQLLEKLNEEIIEKLDNIELPINMSTSTEMSMDKFPEGTSTIASNEKTSTVSMLVNFLDESTTMSPKSSETNISPTTFVTELITKDSAELMTTTEPSITEVTKRPSVLPPPLNFMLNITEIFPEKVPTITPTLSTTTSNYTSISTTEEPQTTTTEAESNADIVNESLYNDTIVFNKSKAGTDIFGTEMTTVLNMIVDDEQTTISSLTLVVPDINENDLEFVPDYPEQFQADFETDSSVKNNTDKSDLNSAEKEVTTMSTTKNNESVDKSATMVTMSVLDSTESMSTTGKTITETTTSHLMNDTEETTMSLLETTLSPEMSTTNKPQTIVSFVTSVTTSRKKSSKTFTKSSTQSTLEQEISSTSSSLQNSTTTTMDDVVFDENTSTMPIQETTVVNDDSTSVTKHIMLSPTTMRTSLAPENETETEEIGTTTMMPFDEMSTALSPSTSKPQTIVSFVTSVTTSRKKSSKTFTESSTQATPDVIITSTPNSTPTNTSTIDKNTEKVLEDEITFEENTSTTSSIPETTVALMEDVTEFLNNSSNIEKATELPILTEIETVKITSTITSMAVSDTEVEEMEAISLFPLTDTTTTLSPSTKRPESIVAFVTSVSSSATGKKTSKTFTESSTLTAPLQMRTENVIESTLNPSHVKDEQVAGESEKVVFDENTTTRTLVDDSSNNTSVEIVTETTETLKETTTSNVEQHAKMTENVENDISARSNTTEKYYEFHTKLSGVSPQQPSSNFETTENNNDEVIFVTEEEIPAKEETPEKVKPSINSTSVSTTTTAPPTATIPPSINDLDSNSTDTEADYFAELFTANTKNLNSSLILDIITNSSYFIYATTVNSSSTTPSTAEKPRDQAQGQESISLQISTGRGNRSLTNPEAIEVAQKLGSQISNVVSQLLFTSHRNFHLLPLFTECANAKKPRKKSRVLNLEYEHLPHVIRIGTMEPGGLVYSCAGTLISKRYVLASAHCLENKFPITTVLIEEESNEKHYVEIEKITMHPNYSNKTLANDLALIRLKEEQIGIKPICLPFEDAYGIWDSVQQNPGDTATLSGWTKSEKKVDEQVVHIIPTKNCTSAFNFPAYLSENQLCTNNPSSMTNYFSRGSPLTVVMTRHKVYFQIGLLSNYNDRAQLHTKLTTHLQWILDSLQE